MEPKIGIVILDDFLKRTRSSLFICFLLNVTAFMLCPQRYYYCFSKCPDIWMISNKLSFPDVLVACKPSTQAVSLFQEQKGSHRILASVFVFIFTRFRNFRNSTAVAVNKISLKFESGVGR